MRKATFSFYGNCILLYQELLPPLTTAIEITIFSIFLEIDIWSYELAFIILWFLFFFLEKYISMIMTRKKSFSEHL